jgi:putative colanic acid biosynthesis acetyltransferase WcaB
MTLPPCAYRHYGPKNHTFGHGGHRSVDAAAHTFFSLFPCFPCFPFLPRAVVIRHSDFVISSSPRSLNLWNARIVHPLSIKAIFQDWEANHGNPKGQLVLALFRLAQWVRALPEPWWLLGIPYLAFYRLQVEWILGIELRFKTRVGPRLRLFHGQALVVHETTVIGADCILRQSTTIGNKTLPDGSGGPSPVLGNGVDVGSNAIILGAITIGDGAVIGAGAVVLKDVPARAVVAGNPARIISQS